MKTREQIVRGAFSTLAGAVFLMTASEWLHFFRQYGGYWRLAVAIGLAAMAIFEADSIWGRVDRRLKQL